MIDEMKKVLLLSIITVLVISACSSSNDESSTAEKTQCGDPILSSDSKPLVEMQTSLGNFTIELDTENAPISASHFAARVEEGFYDGLIFHRVVDNFVIQGGDPEGTGMGSYDCKVISEAPQGQYGVGDIAWARAGNEPAGSAGSQFFVITGTNPLAPEYGYVGKVTEGLEVAQAIEGVDKDVNDRPVQDVVITKAIIKS